MCERMRCSTPTMSSPSMSSPSNRHDTHASATPVKKRKICTPATPYKRPQCSRNILEQKGSKEKWVASNVSLKAKLAASNNAWMTEITEAIMREDLSTFTLLEKALDENK